MSRPHPLVFIISGALILAVFFALLLLGTQDPKERDLRDTGSNRLELSQLFTLLDSKRADSSIRFSLLSRINNIYAGLDQRPRANSFLLREIDSVAKDPLTGVYLWFVAENLRLSGSPDWAALYYRRILDSYPDLNFRNDSLHYRALDQLTRCAATPWEKKEAFEEIQTRYADRTASAVFYYHLGRNWEELGEWDKAIEAYSRFMTFPPQDFQISGKGKDRIRNMVDFYRSNKNWTTFNLDELIGAVRVAAQGEDSDILENLRAQVNFFAKEWDAQETSFDGLEGFDPDTFIRNIIKYGKKPDGTNLTISFGPLTMSPGGAECFLKSTGWYFRNGTWYFTFRKVDYPADPSFNGAWEWSGVYFGERPKD